MTRWYDSKTVGHRGNTRVRGYDHTMTPGHRDINKALGHQDTLSVTIMSRGHLFMFDHLVTG